MRSIFAILLGCLLLLVLARPVVPHLLFQLNKGQIQSSFCEQRDLPRSCCKGSCFLRKQLLRDDPSQSHGIATEATSVGLEEWLPGTLNWTVSEVVMRLEPVVPADEVAMPETFAELPTPPPWKSLIA